MLWFICFWHSFEWTSEPLHPPDVSFRHMVKQEMLKAQSSQTALYYKDIVSLNSLSPMCFSEEVIVVWWCGNNLLCRGGTFVVLNYRKKRLVLGVLAEPFGSGTHVLLLTFFHLIKRENRHDPTCAVGRQAGSWDLGQNSRKLSSSWGAGKAKGGEGPHTHIHTY